MSYQLFQPLNNPNEKLHVQIRQQIVSAILDGCLDKEVPLPPSRKLAQQLQVGRNTVVNVYERLLSEGYLVCKERSGYFVNPSLRLEQPELPSSDDAERTGTGPNWESRLQGPLLPERSATPNGWKNFEYPFVYNQLDPALFPVQAWRECCRDAVRVRDIQDWSPDHNDVDDPMLIEQLRKRVLPRRGIYARKDEVLITLGSQHGLYMLAQLLMSEQTRVGIEDPGYPEATRIARLQQATIRPLAVDDQGLVVDKTLDDCDYVYCTPSYQCPTTVTLSLQRRQQLLEKAREKDVVIIEDDYENEVNFSAEPTPALKGLDTDNRVIYLSSLSKTLAPGLRIGVMVAPVPLIRRARQLRHLMLKHPPVNNQRAVALFIKRGFQDSLIRKLTQVFERRCQLMASALDRHLPGHYQLPSGGSSFWLRLPESANCQRIREMAASNGILVQSGDFYSQNKRSAGNYLKLGFSAIPDERIEPGIARLAELLKPLQ